MIRRGRESGKLTVEDLLHLAPVVGTHVRLREAAVSAFDHGLRSGVGAEAAQVRGRGAVLEGCIVRIGVGRAKR